MGILWNPGEGGPWPVRENRLLGSRLANKPSVTPRAALLVWIRDRLRQPHDHRDFSNLEAVTGYDGSARAPCKHGAN
jgi:hypothetical protein